MKIKPISIILQALICFSSFVLGQNQGGTVPPPVTSEYEKASTTFNGVTFESVVGYLSLPGNLTVFLPIQTSDTLNQNIDYTVMAWLKLTETPLSATPVLFFALTDALACFVDSDFDFVCETQGYRKIIVRAASITLNQWFHFTLSVQLNGVAYIQIEDNLQVIAQVNKTGFYVKQVQQQASWQICVGQCIPTLSGFVGGLRELLVFNQFVSQKSATANKNVILPYNSKIKGYYRFSGDPLMFLSDQYSARQAQTLAGQTQNLTDFKSYEMIPVDVCPPTFNQLEFYHFGQSTKLMTYSIKNALKQTGYSYTLLATIFLESATCYTQDFQNALLGCNLVNFADVFMIYFEEPNLARVHFFASKSYYQTQSVAFFVPFNQIISLQLSLNQQTGYILYILNQWGQVITNLSMEYNLQQQIPGQKLNLFQGLVGVVDVFELFDQQILLPILSQSSLKPLVAFHFNASTVFSQTIINKGSEPGNIQFVGLPATLQIPYQNFLQKSGSASVQNNVYFDGIACNNNQLALSMGADSSYIAYQIPSYLNQQNQSSLQFWFKLQDMASYNTTSFQFVLIDPSTNLKYWQVTLKNGSLVIAPFGMYNYSSPTIPIPDFNQNNKDVSGWWHLSCSYKFSNVALCTLYNTKIEVTWATYLSYSAYFIPNNTLQVRFFKQTGVSTAQSSVLIKEIRFWNRQILLPEIQQYRYQQIDPSIFSGLVSYVRLIGGLQNIFNDLAQISTGKVAQSVGSVQGVSLIPDLILQNSTIFNQTTQSVQVVRTEKRHTICPLQTYYYLNDMTCYSNLINEALLAVFPFKNGDGSLSWLFSVEYSTSLNETLLSQMQVVWEADDFVVNNALQNAPTLQFKIVPAEKFRQQDQYGIQSTFTNAEGTLLGQSRVQFVPNKCHWFEVDGSDALNGSRQINLVQGVQDIYIILILQTNGSLNCDPFDYFTSFDSLTFQYLISNSNQYLTAQPLTTYRFVNISQQQANGQHSQNDVVINVTLSAAEQLKLPSWTNINILMTINWKGNSSVDLSNLNSGASMFQNVLYSINFSPSNNNLQVSLTASDSQVTKGQNLLLDGSGTTVSNFPSQMLLYSLIYSWRCPLELLQLCLGQTTNKLALTWQQVSKLPIMYGHTYTITLQVTWIQSYSKQVTESVSVPVVWYNATLPQFQIQYFPSPVLVTAQRTTAFTMIPINFVTGEISNYNLTWQITPALNKSVAVSFSNSQSQMLIMAGAWQANTSYSVSLQLSLVAQTNITVYKQISFQTGGPPLGGSVTIQFASQGQGANQKTVIVAGWVSYLSLQIFYNVFSTFDSAGLQRSQQLNSSPVPQGQTFQFVSTSQNPVQVQILDLSGEFIWVVASQSVQSTDNSTQNPVSTPNTTNQSQSSSNSSQVNSTAENNNSASNSANNTQVNSTQNQTFQSNSSSQSQNTTNSSANSTSSQSTNTQNSSSRTNTTQLNGTTNSNDTSNAVQNNQTSLDQSATNATDQTTQQSNNTNSSESDQNNQTSQNQNVTNGTDQTVTPFTNTPATSANVTSTTQDSNNSTQTATSLHANSAGRHLQLSGQIETLLRNYTQLTVSNVSGVVSQIIQLLNQIQDKPIDQALTLLAFDMIFNATNGLENQVLLMPLLERLIRAQNQGQDESSQVIVRLKSLDPTIFYKSQTIHIDSVKFIPQSMNNLVPIKAFDASLNFEPGLLVQQFQNQVKNEFYLRVVSVKPANQASVLYFEIYDEITQYFYRLGSVNSAITIRFDYQEISFRYNQTQCATKNAQSRIWITDFCLTEFDAVQSQVICTCNLMETELITVIEDQTRTSTIEVQIPKNYVNKEGYQVEIKGSSYLFISVISALCTLSTLGAIVAWKQDRIEQSNAFKTRKLTKSEHQLMKEFSNALQKSEQHVKMNLESLISFYIQSPIKLLQVTSCVHPLLQPFVRYDQHKSRLLRISCYTLQLNLFALFCMVYFNNDYRRADSYRQDNWIDHNDIQAVIMMVAIAAITLLPFLSELISYLLADRTSEKVSFSEQTLSYVRTIFVSLTLLLSFVVLLIGVFQFKILPTTNQYLITAALTGGIFVATFFTNIIRALINYVSYETKLHFLTCLSARQVLKELSAIDQVSKTFATFPTSAARNSVKSRSEMQIDSNSVHSQEDNFDKGQSQPACIYESTKDSCRQELVFFQTKKYKSEVKTTRLSQIN